MLIFVTGTIIFETGVKKKPWELGKGHPQEKNCSQHPEMILRQVISDGSEMDVEKSAEFTVLYSNTII